MKKVNQYFVVSMFFLSIFLLGCSNNQEEVFVKHSTDIIKPLGVATLQDFKGAGILLSEDGIENSVELLSIGSMPENALVPLIFDPNGKIYAPEKYAKDFDAIMDGRIKVEIYYTDLMTFKKVTNFQYATKEYVLDMGDNNNHHYVLDYLRQKQIPLIERLRQIEEKIKMNVTGSRVLSGYTVTPFKECDVLVGKWTNGNQYGHACIVYSEAMFSSTSLITFINSTTTFDAWGSMPNPVDDIGYHNMSSYWSSSNLQYRYLLKPSIALTASQRKVIKDYSIAQDNDTYSWATTLSNEDKWYCSKLVWKAYKQIGRDIGNNPTIFVTPMDIATDSDMTLTVFGIV